MNNNDNNKMSETNLLNNDKNLNETNSNQGSETDDLMNQNLSQNSPGQETSALNETDFSNFYQSELKDIPSKNDNQINPNNPTNNFNQTVSPMQNPIKNNNSATHPLNSKTKGMIFGICLAIGLILIFVGSIMVLINADISTIGTNGVKDLYTGIGLIGMGTMIEFALFGVFMGIKIYNSDK